MYHASVSVDTSTIRCVRRCRLSNMACTSASRAGLPANGSGRPNSLHSALRPPVLETVNASEARVPGDSPAMCGTSAIRIVSSAGGFALPASIALAMQCLTACSSTVTRSRTTLFLVRRFIDRASARSSKSSPSIAARPVRTSPAARFAIHSRRATAGTKALHI